jgi:hypothetical protein
MIPHPELYFWLKCSICGYCSLELSELSNKNKELAKQNPMCPNLETAVRRLRQQDQDKKEELDLPNFLQKPQNRKE